jgi:hypothetical protein
LAEELISKSRHIPLARSVSVDAELAFQLSAVLYPEQQSFSKCLDAAGFPAALYFLRLFALAVFRFPAPGLVTSLSQWLLLLLPFIIKTTVPAVPLVFGTLPSTSSNFERALCFSCCGFELGFRIEIFSTAITLPYEYLPRDFNQGEGVMTIATISSIIAISLEFDKRFSRIFSGDIIHCVWTGSSLFRFRF